MTIRASFSHLATAEITDLGLLRSRNEDAIIRIPEAGVFCVADGIGGADVGDEASAVTVKALRHRFETAHHHPMAHNFAFRKQLVHEAMNDACQAIRTYCEERGYRQSGTTAVTIVFDAHDPTRAAVMHAGDSRAYRLRGHEITRLTTDHTMAVENTWSDKNAWVFGMRTIITRAVGVRPFVELDETEVDVRPGDVFLLCTDGLTRMVCDQVIAELIREHGTDDLEHTVRHLVDEANNAGGKDNITILMVRVDDVAESMPRLPAEEPLTLWRSMIRMLPAWMVRRRPRAACTPMR